MGSAAGSSDRLEILQASKNEAGLYLHDARASGAASRPKPCPTAWQIFQTTPLPQPGLGPQNKKTESPRAVDSFPLISLGACCAAAAFRPSTPYTGAGPARRQPGSPTARPTGGWQKEPRAKVLLDQSELGR